MKIVIRTLVVALALTGAIASTHADASSASAVASSTKMSGYPIPSCPLDDPDGCGIGGIQ